MNNTQKEILKYLESKQRPVSAFELSNTLGKSRVTIHSNLKKMVTEDILIKKGLPPKVYYEINDLEKPKQNENFTLNPKISNLIQENFLLLTPDGKEVEGIGGFIKWCIDRKYSIQEKSIEYKKHFDEYTKQIKGGAIDATTKIKNSFKNKIFLDHLYYLHPHSIPVFGKTKITQLLFHAKQTQDKKLIQRVLDMVVPEIKSFLEKNKFDSIAFVPPTVQRNIQFMKLLEIKIASNLPKINIEKIRTNITIQQKSLKDINDRIKNAEQTMIVLNHNTNYKKTLIIDDFTGSGATLNVIAGKIKKQNISKNISGLTITGSMNGFEVIKEI